MQKLDPHTPVETVSVLVTGKVQGVGYRFSAVRRAHMIGVGGWVRNNDDGSVQAVVQGTPDQVDQMLEWMRQGPPHARVVELATERIFSDRRFASFEQQ
jgi:acylphosphatase